MKTIKTPEKENNRTLKRLVSSKSIQELFKLEEKDKTYTINIYHKFPNDNQNNNKIITIQVLGSCTLKELYSLIANSSGENIQNIEKICSATEEEEEEIIKNDIELQKAIQDGVTLFEVYWKEKKKEKFEKENMKEIVKKENIKEEGNNKENSNNTNINTEDSSLENKNNQEDVMNELDIPSSDETEEEDINEIQDEEKLKQILEKEKLSHEKSKKKYKLAKYNVIEARKTISKLIKQIKLYKESLEKKRNELQKELSELEKLIITERKANLLLKERRKKLDEERNEKIKQLKEYQLQHNEILKEEKDSTKQMKKENLQNLQILMKELEDLETINENLTVEQEKLNQEIKEEKEKHAKIIEQLIKIKQDCNVIKEAIEQTKVTNTALVERIKELQHDINQPYEQRELKVSQVIKEAEKKKAEIINAKNLMRVLSGENQENLSTQIQSHPIEEEYECIKQLQPEHPGSVRSLIIVQQKVWAGCGDGSIVIWEMETGQMLEKRIAHTSSIYDLKFIREKYVWSVSKDKIIFVWSPTKSQPLRKISSGFCITLLEVDDSHVWCGTIDGIIKVFNSKTYKMQKELKSNSEAIGCMLKRGPRVWCGTDRNIIVWTITTFNLYKILEGHRRTINALCSVGPYEIWSCSSDKTIRCWNADTQQCIKILEAESRIFCLCEMRTTTSVWSGSWGLSLCVWNAKTYELTYEYKTKHKDAISVIIMDNKEQIWSGSWDNTITIWRKKTNKSSENIEKKNTTSNIPEILPISNNFKTLKIFPEEKPLPPSNTAIRKSLFAKRSSMSFKRLGWGFKKDS